MKSKNIIILSIALFAIVLGGFSIAKYKGLIGNNAVTQVIVEIVTPRTIIETVNASGKIYPEIEVKLSPDVSGEIRELYIEEGDSVVAGQLLAKINPDFYMTNVERSNATVNMAQTSIESAKAAYTRAKINNEKAEKEYYKYKTLLAEKVISDQDFITAEVSYKSTIEELKSASEGIKNAQFSTNSANANLKESRDNLSKTTIVAPISGIVSKLQVEKGERVVGTSQMAGTEMMRIANMNSMEVRVDINESDVVKVHLGDSVDIEVDAYINKIFKGIVTKIANSSGNASASIGAEQATTFTVRIKVIPSSYSDLLTTNNRPFRPGMSATVAIKTKIINNAISVPIQSVTLRDDSNAHSLNTTIDKQMEQKEVVFIVNKNNTISQKFVTTGIQNEKYLQIINGISLDEKVVSGPYSTVTRKLKDKQKVEITTKDKIKVEETKD
jgi:HlyD family secretion protein